MDKNGNAMLADFGVSLITDEKINSTEGTYYFMARKKKIILSVLYK